MEAKTARAAKRNGISKTQQNQSKSSDETQHTTQQIGKQLMQPNDETQGTTQINDETRQLANKTFDCNIRIRLNKRTEQCK